MLGELVSTITEDKIVLNGILYPGDKSRPAVIIQHGAGMNFYTGMGRFLPTIIADSGFTCISVNNRGHDFGTAPDGDKKPVIGLMRENFEDCRLDTRAWMDFMYKRGYSRIVMLAHSQGVLKVIYAVNREQFCDIAGLVLVSPPPSAMKMMRYLLGDYTYERALFHADEMVKMGKGDQLLVLKGIGKMPWAFTAETFLDFYGPESSGNTIDLVKDIRCSMLLTRGSEDFPPMSQELLQRIKENAGYPGGISIIEIIGAGHFYTGYEEILGKTICEWIIKTYMS